MHIFQHYNRTTNRAIGIPHFGILPFHKLQYSCQFGATDSGNYLFLYNLIGLVCNFLPLFSVCRHVCILSECICSIFVVGVCDIIKLFNWNTLTFFLLYSFCDLALLLRFAVFEILLLTTLYQTCIYECIVLQSVVHHCQRILIHYYMRMFQSEYENCRNNRWPKRVVFVNFSIDFR